MTFVSEAKAVFQGPLLMISLDDVAKKQWEFTYLPSPHLLLTTSMLILDL